MQPFFVSAASLLGMAWGSAVPFLGEYNHNIVRASNQAPNGYAPGKVDCPNPRPTIRDSSVSVMSPQEHEWVARRRKEIITPLQDLLKRVDIPGFDNGEYFADVESSSPALPIIGIAVSGGGHRSALNGAGAIAAFDSRSPGSTNKGNLGGLLQSTTYLSGLSGGSWLVGSIYANNFTAVHDAVNSGTIWQFSKASLLRGPKGFWTTLGYYWKMGKQTLSKSHAGFDASLTDMWGRMLSYQFVNAIDGGPGVTFSSVTDDDEFASAKAPMPILTSSSRAPGEKKVTLYNTLFEFNPWEMGSSNPTLHGFAPLKYTGSKFEGGKLPDTEACINGFDNLGFVMGTSSSIFNAAIEQVAKSDSDGLWARIWKFLARQGLSLLGKKHDDIADWTPNPFRDFSDGFDGSKLDRLTLVDGGLDGQNVPFHPHLAIERKVDVIFAIDASKDINSWPNGTSLTNTYQRSLNPVADGTSFPVVPGSNTFVNLGLNSRPTFFGCNSTETAVATPLVVYLPNYPMLMLSNTSTLKLSYTDSERDGMIANGWASATQLNSTIFQDWDVCVGCAILSRSFERSGKAPPDACRNCFRKFCWDGTIDESEPEAPYNPTVHG